MTETIEQFAARVCEKIGSIPHKGGPAFDAITAILPQFLASHAPKPALDVHAVAVRLQLDAFDPALNRAEFVSRAKEVLTRHVTDAPAWIACPVTVGEAALVVPKSGWYFVRFDAIWATAAEGFPSGPISYSDACAIRSYDRLNATVGPIIERQPTTTRVWTAESVRAACGRCVMVEKKSGELRLWSGNTTDDAERLASEWNSIGYVAYHIVPEPPHD